MKKQGWRARERERNKRGKATGHGVQREEVQARGREPDRERHRKRPSEVTGYKAEREEFKKIWILSQTKRDREIKNGDGQQGREGGIKNKDRKLDRESEKGKSPHRLPEREGGIKNWGQGFGQRETEKE